MYKQILLLIFFITAYFAHAQEATKNFNILLSAGVTPAQVHGDAYNGFHKLGFMGGIGIERIFNKKASMSFSFLFIQKGARKNQNIEKNDYSAYYLNLNYVEVPLMVTYTQKKFIFDIGLAGGYLINYYEADQVNNYTGQYPFRKYEFSIKAGLGYNITPKLFANFRTSNSFVTIRPNYIKQAIYYNNIIARTFNKGYYNNILEFALTYRIQPHKKQ